MARRGRIRRIVVVANPAAGRDEPVLAALNDAWAASGIDWDVAVTHEAGDAAALAREAAGAGADAVGAYGGDGTVMEVASGLLGTGVPLAILPGGTANVLARDLGLPLALLDAARLVAGAHALRPLDVGEVGERHFVLRLAAGLEAEMNLRADREAKDRLGIFAYPVAALAAAREAPVVRYRITIDGEHVEAEGVTCIVANSGSVGVGGLSLAPDIDVSDGLLDVVVLSSADTVSILSVVGDVVAGRPPAPGEVQRWKGREVRVSADARQRVAADGEPAGRTPLTARVLPAAVRVVVPGG